MKFSTLATAAFAAFATASPIERRNPTKTLDDVRILVNEILGDTEFILSDFGLNSSHVFGDNDPVAAAGYDGKTGSGSVIIDTTKLITDIIKNSFQIAEDVGLDFKSFVEGFGN